MTVRRFNVKQSLYIYNNGDLRQHEKRTDYYDKFVHI